ncbi:Nodulation-signaling pathway 2 protein [Apostasia shenzhenica]|uniref:Nodulation-signaling pathway 2 protein n=1 Tax=Apostasia shenzhenica TaxID=1088818 RepID=A0A2I0AD84_9ASPA|nr:Nodulation-signaling pathway 2 protein [Apostasia shenzhenica]
MAEVSELLFPAWTSDYIITAPADKPPAVGFSPFSCSPEAMDWLGPSAPDVFGYAESSPETADHWSSAATSSSTSAVGTPADASLAGSCDGDDEKGQRLVHLLMAAAEAIAGCQGSQLAHVILARLNESLHLPLAAGEPSGMERLTSHFTVALWRLLRDGLPPADDELCSSEVVAAFELLQDLSPYVKFGHLTANQAIIEAVVGERRIHIVDFDIMEGVQWPSLMQALVTMKNVPPPAHLRITAVTRAGGRRRSPTAATSVGETGRRLAAFAASIGLPFSFRQCRLEPGGSFRPASVKVVRGEAVVFNCALHPPHQRYHSAATVGSFLAGAAALGARVVTLVEEEGTGGCAGVGEEEKGFVWRFMEEMLRYSAILDSLEAGFPEEKTARETVERVILAPRIAGAVDVAYRWRNDWVAGWSEWMSAAGFRRVVMSAANHWQAKLLLGLFNEGYGIEEDNENKLLLRWKSRPLVGASVWAAPAPSSGECGRLGLFPC